MELTPTLTRRLFVASIIMMITAVSLSVFNTATVLSAPVRTAVGVPSAVGFEGFLAEANGQPIANGIYQLTFRVYGVPAGGSALWTEQHNSVQVTNGLYSVVLGATTPFAGDTFNITPGTSGRWIGVTVNNGAEISPRTQVSSVPFALNADNANRIGGGGVEGMVAAFDGPCPQGWTEFAAAQGRYILGLPPNGQLGATVGTALGPQENRPVGQHTHTINDPGHSHGVSNNALRGNTGGGNGAVFGALNSGDHYGNIGISPSITNISLNSAGTVPGTNAPYIQLRYCKLNG